MALNTPLINGKRYSWANITLVLFGRNVEGITEISYDDSEKKANIYGAGKYPVARGDGQYEAKASITLKDYEVTGILASSGRGKRLQDIAPFDVVVLYELDGVLMKDVIRNAEFMSTGKSIKSGDNTIDVKVELIVSHIEWNN